MFDRVRLPVSLLLNSESHMLTTTFVEGIIVIDEGINQEGVIKVGKAILHAKNTATDKHIQVSLKLNYGCHIRAHAEVFEVECVAL